jgi:DNA transformation protein
LRTSQGFNTFVLDQLQEFGEVLPRSMFGGVGLYHADLFFGIIAGDVLYLKVDDSNRHDYERRGMQPFKPYPHRPATMRYFEVPLDVLESGLELAAWARKAVAAAARATRRVRRPSA